MDNKEPQVIDLSDFFITHSQANDFSVRLTSIIEQMYTTNYNFEKAMNAQFGIQKADIFLKILRDNGLQNATLRQVQEFLKKMQETVKNLSVVSLTLAFEPTDEVLKTFAQWFVFNLKRQVIFDIQIDHHLIAGVKINYKGKFKDYSLGPLFEKMTQGMLHPHASVPSQQTTQPPHQNVEQTTMGK